MADFEISYYGYPYPREIKIWKREFDGGRGWHFVQVNEGLVIREWRVPKDGLFHAYDFRGRSVDVEDLQSFGFVRVCRDG